MTTTNELWNTVRASVRLYDQVRGNVDRLVTDVVRDSRTVARDAQALYRSAADTSGAVRDMVRGAPRFARIVTEGARLIAAYRLHRELAPALEPEVAAARLERLHAKSAARLYELCVELRGGVLKLGQFLSCRMDLLPAAYAEALGQLQDRVPSVDIATIRARIEAELGAPVDELYAAFDDQPIAAASLAQVHAARLADGSEVAVKVLVPGIEDVVETDIAALRALATLAGDLIPGDTGTVCRELARSLRDELDYRAEAENAAAIAACFAGDDRIQVPAVVAERSSGRVLTLERVHGSRLIHYLDAHPGDRDRILALMVESFCAQVLSHGVLHADPHPGNFLVAGDGRLTLLDFGALQRYTPEQRRGYAQLAAAVLCNDAARSAALLTELGFATRDGNPESLLVIADLILESFRESASLADVDPSAQLQRALDIARAHPIARVPEHFVMLGRIFGALGGLIMKYRPNIPLARILAPHLSAALRA